MNTSARATVNTIVLYVKLLLSTVIAFFNVPLLLKALGVENYGIFCVVGGAANVGAILGLAIVVNIFCGVTVNTALGIAKQVYSAMWQVFGNFQTAYMPLLMKLYASKQQDELIKLSFLVSKLSFILVLLVSLPLFINADYVPTLWLGMVPEYSVIFARLCIVCMIMESPFASQMTLSRREHKGIPGHRQFHVSFHPAAFVPIAARRDADMVCAGG